MFTRLSNRAVTTALFGRTARNMSTTPAAPPRSTFTDFWQPSQYLLFQEARHRPGVDLIQRISFYVQQVHGNAEAVKTVYDLGCGTGKLAVELAKTFAVATVTGVDSSQNMLDMTAQEVNAKESKEVTERMRWVKQDVATFDTSSIGGADIVFSNACLHWLRDHHILFPHLIKQVRAGGIFAVQIPGNFSEPTHTSMLEALKACSLYDGHMHVVWAAQPSVPQNSFYYHTLEPYASIVDVWETQYLHPLMEAAPKQPNDPIYHPALEWTKGSALGPILSGLRSRPNYSAAQNEDAVKRFLQCYSDILSQKYPLHIQTNRTVSTDSSAPQLRCALLPFKRIFMVAVRK